MKVIEAKKSFRQAKVKWLLEYTKTDSNGCMIWQGCIGGSSGKYGYMSLENKGYLVHRYIAFSELEDDEFLEVYKSRNVIVMHTCDNTLCINPEHLKIGDHSNNLKDAYNKGRRSALGENNPRTKVTEQQVKEIRQKYKIGIVSYNDLAKEYGIDISTVQHIVYRITWAHVE